MERRKAVLNILQVLGAAVIAVTLITLYLVYGPGYKVLFDKTAEKRFMTFKVMHEHAYDAVVLGDSRVYRGFDPAVFEAETGLKTLNLGFSSGGFTQPLFDLAEKHLDPGGAKLIILSVTPFSVTREAGKNEHLKLWEKKSRADLLVNRHLEKYLIYLSPDAIKSIFGDFSKNPYLQTYYDNGFVASTRKFKDTDAGVRAYREQFKNEKVSIEIIQRLVGKIIEWQERGYTVMAYRPPAYSEVTKVEDETSGWPEENFSHAIQGRQMEWIRFEDEKFDSYDGSHLTADSAHDLTHQLVLKYRAIKSP